MARKLTDAEFVQRTRENNRRRSERQRQRLTIAGKSALTVWIPDPVRKALTAAAAERSATIADTAAQWLMTAATLNTLPTDTREKVTPPPVDSLPLFNTTLASDSASEPPRGPADARLARILALKREQPELSNYAIAGQVGCSEPTVRRALKKPTQEAV